MIGSGLFTTYSNIVGEAFIQDLGKDIVLYYTDLTLQNAPSNAASPYGLTNFDSEGNPIHLSSLGGRPQESGINFVDTPVTETIKGRVYWETRVSILRDLNAKIDDKICQINTYHSYASKLERASKIQIDSPNNPLIKLNAIMVAKPMPYGLGPAQFSISFWKVI